MDSTAQATVLIHGYGFDPRIWQPVELAFEGHKTIYLSLPGFGKDPVTAGYTIEELAINYWKYLDGLNINTVNLVGHSMGGYVCLEMLAKQNSRVSSFALIHSHVYADSEEKKSSRSGVMLDIKTNGRMGLVNKLIPSLVAENKYSAGIVSLLIKRGLQYDDNAWYYGTQAIRDRIDHSETLKNTRVPVLMLMGESDKVVPADLAYKQASLAERTVLHMYPNVAHVGMYENTARMIYDLVNFYSGVI